MKQEALAQIEARIPVRQKLRIEEIARVHGVNRSKVVRKAIDHFLETLDKKNNQKRDELILERLDRQQERLVSLLIKAMRGVAQVLFVTGQMWEQGLPSDEGLTEEEMRELWDASRRYAHEWVKKREDGN